MMNDFITHGQAFRRMEEGEVLQGYRVTWRPYRLMHGQLQIQIITDLGSGAEFQWVVTDSLPKMWCVAKEDKQ